MAADRTPDTGPLVLVDRPRDDVAVVTLNRPDRLNALSFALVDELHAAIDGTEEKLGVTPANVHEVFGLACEVIADPMTGTPLVLPVPAVRARA